MSCRPSAIHAGDHGGWLVRSATVSVDGWSMMDYRIEPDDMLLKTNTVCTYINLYVWVR